MSLFVGLDVSYMYCLKGLYIGFNNKIKKMLCGEYKKEGMIANEKTRVKRANDTEIK